MSGKIPRVNPLQSRKQLLIAESEINRVQLCREWQKLTAEAGVVADKAKSFNSIATSILSLVATVGNFTNTVPAPAAAKTSWLQKISSGVKLASTVWLMFRSRNSSSEKK